MRLPPPEASHTARLRDELGIDVALEPVDRRGPFEIQVAGRTVVERRGGLIARLTGRPWPEPEGVVGAVRDALGR